MAGRFNVQANIPSAKVILDTLSCECNANGEVQLFSRQIYGTTKCLFHYRDCSSKTDSHTLNSFTVGLVIVYSYALLCVTCSMQERIHLFSKKSNSVRGTV